MEVALSATDVATSDQLLSVLLRELTEALAPNSSLLIFPQDLSTSNTIVSNVVSKLRDDIENNTALTLHTVRKDYKHLNLCIYLYLVFDVLTLGCH